MRNKDVCKSNLLGSFRGKLAINLTNLKYKYRLPVHFPWSALHMTGKNIVKGDPYLNFCLISDNARKRINCFKPFDYIAIFKTR